MIWLALLRRAWPYLLGAALLGVIGWQRHTIGGLHENLGAERATRAAAIEANQTQADTITQLERAVKAWQALAAVADDIKAQAAQAADYRAQLDRASADIHQVKTHESPDCQSLLAVDFGARCPALSVRLRELAHGHNENPDGRSPGARPETPP